MARDLIHFVVKHALEKEGWKVTHDPFPIKIGGFDMEIDLGAEIIFAAEKDSEKIAIEIKTFAGLSKTYEFHLAVGQFIDYRIALKVREPNRVLYIGITDDIYEDVFQLPFAQMVIEELGMKLIVVNAEKTEIVLWKK
jgi:hypothetical protein